ncbi:MAG: RagB/SusD family nutrient uptake outer membrane protein [Cyclobacteriaceae bacterium]|nr:RagB/SusD family nutrient uptake outer membrane protein [Cyclobacteriaceae bacterium]
MKKYIDISIRKIMVLAIVPLLMISSCDKDFLEEEPLDFLAPDNAYNSVAGIQQGIAGLHWSVRRSWFSDASGHQDGFAIMLGSVGTDVAFHGENPGGNRKLVNYEAEMTAENNQFTLMWEDSYVLIQRANTLIYGIENSDDAIWGGNMDKKDEYLAESKFFRAWSYYFLVSLWGDVPLVLDKITTAKVNFERAPKEEVFKAMEDDLIFASSKLPLPGDMEAPGRINQKAAWHLLTQVYLNWNKYQDAVNAASKVIDGYGSSLMKNRFGATNDVFGTGDVFLDLHAYGNQNLAENTEAIWVIQNSKTEINGGHNFPGERGWGPAYFRMGRTPDEKPAFLGEFYNGKYTGYLDIYGRPVAWIRPTDYMAYDIWKSDWNNDIRNAEHQVIRTFYFQNPNSSFDGQVVDFSLYPAGQRDALKDTCQYIYPYFMKHADPKNHFTDPSRSGGGYNNKDVYAMRLADTYLLRAEAYIGLGQMGLAADDINEVRTRANATPVLVGDVNLDYLLDERARELYGEEFRHITLRRTGKFLERVRKYCNNPIYPACNVQDYNVLFPIPQKHIDLNIEGVIQQNPGYPGAG